MEFYLLIVAIILLIVLLPYLRILRKRFTMRRRLCRLCLERRYSLHPVRKLWLFGRRMGKTCDFYVETPETVYAVKLFAMKRRGQYLIFTNDGTFRVRKFLNFVSSRGGYARFFRDSKPCKLPDYDFRAGFRDEWYLKDIRPVLLLNPTCIEVHLNKVDRESLLGNGESIAGMTLHTLSSFLGELERSE
ncbi:MAG: hypothetical protein IJX76_02180 [Clostridia bacterium]|nr:hypothetical protein [Clostridia bacterium]